MTSQSLSTQSFAQSAAIWSTNRQLDLTFPLEFSTHQRPILRRLDTIYISYRRTDKHADAVIVAIANIGE